MAFQTTGVNAPLFVLLQVVDERSAQQRLRLAVTVLGVAAATAELTPERDVLVDDRADRVGCAVELADVVRVGQVLADGPEELDVVVLARHGEGALAQLLGGQGVQLGEARSGHDGKHRTARISCERIPRGLRPSDRYGPEWSTPSSTSPGRASSS